MDWKSKYLKYKNKYIELKQEKEINGGYVRPTQIKIENPNIIKKFFNNYLKLPIIDTEINIKSVSGLNTKKISDINIDNVNGITINKYEGRYEMFIKENNNNDMLRLIIKNEGMTTGLFDELEYNLDLLIE